MAWLQEIKKYFFVSLNIKYDLDNSKRLERFIKNPEKIFNAQRLDEHKRHIRNYIHHSLGIEEVEIICIHAYAAFLSDQPQYINIANKLWEISQIEEIYSLIASEIYTRGQQRCWNTFFDAVIHFLDVIIKMLERHKKSLVSQADFMQDKRAEIEDIFQESVKNGKIKIQRSCHAASNIIDLIMHDWRELEKSSKSYHKVKENLHFYQQQLYAADISDDLSPMQLQYEYLQCNKRTENLSKQEQFLISQIERLKNLIDAKSFTISSLCGALLQISKQGISIVHRGLGSCPNGRSIGNEALKNIILQWRNQSMHYEENNPN